jgi:thymidylate kinase
MTNVLDAGDRAPPSLLEQKGGRPGEMRGVFMLAVFDALDHSGIRYCVPHGYETYPDHISSDVDCLIDPPTRADLFTLVRQTAAAYDFNVVSRRGYHIVLAGRDETGSLSFLTFDFSTQCEFANLTFYIAAEILHSRRRHKSFWMPSSQLEFGAYLARTITRGSLDPRRGKRLSELFQSAPQLCEHEIGRFWSGEHAALLTSAARSGDWSRVYEKSESLAKALRRRLIARAPLRYLQNTASAMRNRLQRALHPPGVHIALLGTDGAGKSSVIDALGPRLEQLFSRSKSYGFVPELMQRALHGSNRKTDTPHALKPRSVSVSVARALLYWLPYYTLGYAGKYVDLIRSTLVLNDRHLIDVLVDAARYRYGGPRRLLQWVWRVSIKPDLVVLLDAPAEVLYRRKQEMSFDEVARQRAAYAELVRSLPNGHVVDTTCPLDAVVDTVAEIIVNFVAARGVRRRDWRA